MNLVSRNAPVALVTGVAGFLGSHLAEKLIRKNIQVVGVDNLSSGKEQNLKGVSTDTRFLFLKQSIQKGLPWQLPRLDYAFFILPETLTKKDYSACLDVFLEICQKYHCRVVLVSSVELYDSENDKLKNLVWAEKQLTESAHKKNINARLVRLAAVFGPRMHFGSVEPLYRLIQSAVGDNIKNINLPLDFSTRAVYIDDATDLLIKAVMHGATSQKIYDGVKRVPVKLSEIRQVLSDPAWYENYGFNATPLPEWPTPNLSKSEKELLWRPQTNLATALKQTVEYFQHSQPKPLDNQQKLIPAAGVSKRNFSVAKQQSAWAGRKLKLNSQIFALVGVVTLVFYGLIWPLIITGHVIAQAQYNLNLCKQYFKAGDLYKAAEAATLADNYTNQALSRIDSWIMIGKTGLLSKLWQEGEQYGQAAVEFTSGTKASVVAANNLTEAWQVINGQRAGDSGKMLIAAREQVRQGEEQLNLVQGKIAAGVISEDNLVGKWLKGQLKPLEQLRQMADLERGLAEVLLAISGTQEKRVYLLILRDETALTSIGGTPLAAAELVFENGTLRTVNSINPSGSGTAVFGWYSTQFLDEADFPTHARNLLWLYQQETGKQADGIVMMDLAAAGLINQAIDIVNGKSAQGLYAEAVAGRAQVAITVLEKITASLKNTPTTLNQQLLLTALRQSLQEKHLMAFANDQKLLTILSANSWTGELPRPEFAERGEQDDFLALSEADQGTSHANYYLHRQVRLKKYLSPEGMIASRLTVYYQNLSPNEIWPGGSYINKMKVFLPTDSKLTRVFWGEEDITSRIGAFADYGRAGYLVTFELKAGEQKSLSLEYENVRPAEFKEGQLKYDMEFVKQPGTAADNLEFSFALPENMQFGGSSAKQRTQEFVDQQVFDSDLRWRLIILKK